MKKCFDFRMVIFFFVIAVLIASPFIYRAWNIHEIYLYPEVRNIVLDSTFFVREMHGSALADVRIKDVSLEDGVVFVTVNERYVGFIDCSRYNDCNVDYFVKYNTTEGKFSEIGLSEN